MECEVDGCSNPTLITGTSGHARTRACGAHICKSCGGEVVPIAHSMCMGCGPKFCERDGCNSHVSKKNAYSGAGRLCLEHCCYLCHESNEGGEDRICPKCLEKIEASRQQGQRHRQSKSDSPGDGEWGWIIFWFVAAPICAMGGPFGVLLGGFSLMLAIWGTAKKLFK